MPYSMVRPIYEAIQWTGANVEDCAAFYALWFPQPPPPLPGREQPPAFQHDSEASTLTISPGYVVQVGDWMVNGGTWPPGPSWAGSPEVVQDAIFQLKYAVEE